MARQTWLLEPAGGLGRKGPPGLIYAPGFLSEPEERHVLDRLGPGWSFLQREPWDTFNVAGFDGAAVSMA